MRETKEQYCPNCGVVVTAPGVFEIHKKYCLEPRQPRSDHIEATIELLELQIRKLREGVARDRVGHEIELIGRVIAHRT